MKPLRMAVMVLLAIFLVGVTLLTHQTTPPSESITGMGILEGTVTYAGDACSIQYQVVPPCSGPYPNYTITVYGTDGKSIIAVTRTNETGFYRLSLPAGTYAIYIKQLTAGSSSFTLTGVPHQVVIVTDKVSHFDIIIDLGVA